MTLLLNPYVSFGVKISDNHQVESGWFSYPCGSLQLLGTTPRVNGNLRMFVGEGEGAEYVASH